MELLNSTGGTNEFHPWNFLEPIVDRLSLSSPAEVKFGLRINIIMNEKCTANGLDELI